MNNHKNLNKSFASIICRLRAVGWSRVRPAGSSADLVWAFTFIGESVEVSWINLAPLHLSFILLLRLPSWAEHLFPAAVEEVPVCRLDHTSAFKALSVLYLVTSPKWDTWPSRNKGVGKDGPSIVGRHCILQWQSVEGDDLKQLSGLSHWDWEIQLSQPLQLILCTLKFGNFRLSAVVLSANWIIWGLKNFWCLNPNPQRF